MIDKILKIIDDKRDEIINFTRSLVKIRSENPPGNESKVAELIIKKLREYGIENIELKRKEEERPNVIAFLEGEKKRPVLLFNGHMDTKPPGNMDEWKFDPYSAKIIDDSIYGLGACDMKGALAALVMSGACIMEANVLLKGKLLFNFVADEEKGSINGTRWLVDKGYVRADAGLVAEGAGQNKSFDYLYIAARGLIAFDLIVHGTQMHSSISDLGNCVNACLKLSEVLVTMSNEFDLKYEHWLYPQGPTINLGNFIHGGVQYGVVPGKCTAGNDIRLIMGMNPKKIEFEVKEFLNKLKKRDPELRIEMEVKASYEPVEISPEVPIVKSAMKAAKKVLNFEPKIGGLTGTDDASFLIKDAGIPTIPAFGPGLISAAHKPNETVKIKDIIDATKIYSLIALDYLGTV